MRKGTHPSPATIEKMRLAHLGKPSPWKGKKNRYSPAAIEKMREAKQGEKCYNFGKHHSPATIEKNRQAHLGKPRSSETIEKMRLAHLGTHPSPEAIEKMRRARLGKHLSPATKEKMSGENHHNWQGGISFEPYSIAWTEQLKESIRTRDHHTCQLCGKKQEELSEKLAVHHIDYDKKNLDPKNLISLCRSCHMKTNYKRKEWIDFFQTRIEKQNTLEILICLPH